MLLFLLWTMLFTISLTIKKKLCWCAGGCRVAAVRSGTRQPQWAQLLLYTLRGAAVIRLSVKKKKKKRSKGSSRWRAQWCSSRQLQQHPTLKWTEGDWSACKTLQVRHNSIQILSDPGYGRQWISLSRSLPPPAEAAFQDADPFDWGWCSIALVAGDDYTRNGFLSPRSAIF